jgi:uncharacterized protein YcfL
MKIKTDFWLKSLVIFCLISSFTLVGCEVEQGNKTTNAQTPMPNPTQTSTPIPTQTQTMQSNLPLKWMAIMPPLRPAIL